MNFSIQNAIWFVLLLISFAFSGWYFASSKKQYSLDEEALNQLPDNKVTQLKLIQYKVDGKVWHCLQSPQMVHIPKNNTNYFTEPRIHIEKENQEPWSIQASQGVSNHGGDIITLRNNVIMEQKVNPQGGVNRLTTEVLEYYPKNKFAQTHALVSFSQLNSTVTAIGMKAWLDKKRVQLLKQVRGQYDPPNKKS